MRRAIVLGHTGFLGRALVERLRRDDWHVVGYGSGTLDLRRPEALSMLDGLASPDATLFLTAALTPDRGATLDVLADNLTMTLNMARYLDRHPVDMCVYFSSDAVYPMDADPVTETSAVEPAGLYALAKYAGERMLHRAVETAGLRLLVLRVTSVYGPGDTHGSYGPNLFVRTVAREKRVRLFGGGEETRDHVYVSDVAAVAATLAEAGTTGVFNVATGESRTFASIVDELREIVPFDFVVESMPRKNAITHRRFDVSRVRRALPDFRFTGFEDGLRATWAAARDAA